MFCRHHDITAIGFEYASVERTGFGQRAIDIEIDLAGRIGRQADCLGRSQSNPAALIRDHAVVLNDSSMQRDEAALRLDLACVDDRSTGIRIIDRKRNIPFARAKACHRRITDLRRGSNETADIDTGMLAEQHAVRIDNKDLAIARELAIDDGFRIPRHAIECNG